MYLIVNTEDVVIQILNSFSDFKERESDKPVVKPDDSYSEDSSNYGQNFENLDHYFVLEICVGAELSCSDHNNKTYFGVEAEVLYEGEYEDVLKFIKEQSSN